MANISFKLNLLPSTIERMQWFRDSFAEANKYRYTDRERYTVLLDSMYEAESRRRLQLLKQTLQDSKKKEAALLLVSRREHLADWMCDWVWTFDPRNTKMGLPANIPWVPWQQQVDFIEWFYNLYLNGESGLVEKSRDQGATFLFCLIYLWEWRWTSGFTGGVGSNKLKNVDERDNPRCVFEKLRSMLFSQPPWWIPEGFDRKKHDLAAKLINPDNGASISGEGGDNIGRGGRTGAYFIDEAAFLERPEKAEAALSQNTDALFSLSTPNGLNFFGQKRKSGRVKVFTFSWKEDPRKNQEWHDHEAGRLDAVTVAQEIDISYAASVEGLFINPLHIDAAVNFPVSGKGTRSTGLDVAAGGKNRSALCLRSGALARVQEWNYDNGVDLTHRAIEESNRHLAEYMNYDRVGVGFAVHSGISRTESHIGFKYFPIEGGEGASDTFYPEFGKQGKDVFRNKKTEWWYQIARRFEKTYEQKLGKRTYPEEELISIENDGELISQLQSPKKFRLDNGKVFIETKESMIKRGIASPDKADALVMAFIEQAGGVKRVWPGFVDSPQRFAVNFARIDGDSTLLCSQWMEENMEASFILALWNRRKHTLYVFEELVLNNCTAEVALATLCKSIRVISKDVIRNLKNFQWYGNSVMFGHQTQGNIASTYRKYSRAGAHIRQNPRYDEAGGVGRIAQLISESHIVLHARVSELANQMAAWPIEGNQPATRFGLCRALCNIGSALYETGRFKPVPTPDPAYSVRRNRELQQIASLATNGDFQAVELRERGAAGQGTPDGGWMGVI